MHKLSATTRDVFTFNIPLSDSEAGEEEVGAEVSQKGEGRGTERQRGGGINWMAALDYFACRGAHSLPLHPAVLDQALEQRMKEYVGRCVMPALPAYCPALPHCVIPLGGDCTAATSCITRTKTCAEWPCCPCCGEL
jgi:hypothetical protein